MFSRLIFKYFKSGHPLRIQTCRNQRHRLYCNLKDLGDIFLCFYVSTSKQYKETSSNRHSSMLDYNYTPLLNCNLAHIDNTVLIRWVTCVKESRTDSSLIT